MSALITNLKWEWIFPPFFSVTVPSVGFRWDIRYWVFLHIHLTWTQTYCLRAPNMKVWSFCVHSPRVSTDNTLFSVSMHSKVAASWRNYLQEASCIYLSIQSGASLLWQSIIRTTSNIDFMQCECLCIQHCSENNKLLSQELLFCSPWPTTTQLAHILAGQLANMRLRTSWNLTQLVRDVWECWRSGEVCAKNKTGEDLKL